MTMPRDRKRPPGAIVGSLIAITFGTVFVLANSGGLPAPWPLVVRVVGLLVAASLIAGTVVVARTAAAVSQPPVNGFADRRYWLIVAVEAVALFGGLFVVNGVLHRTAISVAWVALVVGVHFFALAWAWRIPLFHRLAAAMTVLGLAGFLIHGIGGSAAAVGLVSGVGSGAALYVTVVAALRQAARTGQRSTA